MIHLLQIMTYMSETLEYSQDEIAEYFTALENGDLDLYDFLAGINIEPWSETQMEVLKNKISKWKSALHVTLLKTGAI